jgi:hypothetical protein
MKTRQPHICSQANQSVVIVWQFPLFRLKCYLVQVIFPTKISFAYAWKQCSESYGLRVGGLLIKPWRGFLRGSQCARLMWVQNLPAQESDFSFGTVNT